MPFTNRRLIQNQPLGVGLLWLDTSFQILRYWVSGAALLVVIGTGLAFQFTPGIQGLLPYQPLRTLHGIAAMVVMVQVLAKLCVLTPTFLYGRLRRLAGSRAARGTGPGPVRYLDGLLGLLALLMGFSGVGHWLFATHGISISGHRIPESFWHPLHLALWPILLAVLLPWAAIRIKRLLALLRLEGSGQ